MLAELLAITVISFLASFHCIGMCGGFALAVASGASSVWSNAGRQIVYSIGRITTYLFLGSIAGAAGSILPVDGAGRWLSIALSATSGVVMILLGLHQFGRTTSGPLHFKFLSRPMAAMMRAVRTVPEPTLPFALGLLTGLLPCGLVAGWLIRAAASGTALTGLLTMTFFGLGTIPAMVTMGLVGHMMPVSLRFRLVQCSGVLLIAFGLFTIVRAIPQSDQATGRDQGHASCILCLESADPS